MKAKATERRSVGLIVYPMVSDASIEEMHAAVVEHCALRGWSVIEIIEGVQTAPRWWQYVVRVERRSD